MTQLLKDIYAVEVPDGSKNHVITGNRITWKMNELKFWWDLKPLPPGNYVFLFTTKAAKEEDYRNLSLKSYGKMFFDYTSKLNGLAAHSLTRKESFESLLRSKGLDPSSNFAIIKQQQ